jgi:cytochrome c oxidase cbb3-type subunit IV
MSEDTLNLLRGLSTVLAMLGFIAVVAWAWSRDRRDAFDRAAQAPLEEDGLTPSDQRPLSSRGASNREAS